MEKAISATMKEPRCARFNALKHSAWKLYRPRVFVPSEAFDCTEIIFSPGETRDGIEGVGRKEGSDDSNKKKKGGKKKGRKGKKEKKERKKVIAVNGFTGFPKNKRARSFPLSFPRGTTIESIYRAVLIGRTTCERVTRQVF